MNILMNNLTNVLLYQTLSSLDELCFDPSSTPIYFLFPGCEITKRRLASEVNTHITRREENI